MWHFPCVHHDLWDHDNPCPPVVVTVQHDGKTVRAVAQVTKTGHCFLLDRKTGEPLFGVVHAAFAGGAIPSTGGFGKLDRYVEERVARHRARSEPTGKGRSRRTWQQCLAKLQAWGKLPRLTRRVLLCTIAASAVLGGGTAGALMSIGRPPAHAVRGNGATHAPGSASIQIDPGGPIILAPEPTTPPAAATAPLPLPTPAHLSPPTPPPPPIGAAALSQISYPWQQLGYRIVFLGPRPDLMEEPRPAHPAPTGDGARDGSPGPPALYYS